MGGFTSSGIVDKPWSPASSWPRPACTWCVGMTSAVLDMVWPDASTGGTGGFDNCSGGGGVNRSDGGAGVEDDSRDGSYSVLVRNRTVLARLRPVIRTDSGDDCNGGGPRCP